MTIEHKLDEILIELKSCKDKRTHYDSSVMAGRICFYEKDIEGNPHPKVDYHELDYLWRKLVSDKYAVDIDSPFGYPITADGELFINAGGYIQQAINEKIKIDSLAAQIRRTERNEERLVHWTKYLYLATLLLVLVEVLIHGQEIRHLFQQ